MTSQIADTVGWHLSSLVLFCLVCHTFYKDYTLWYRTVTDVSCRLFFSLCMCHFSQIQIVATCLDDWNVPSLPDIPPREVEAAWKHVKDMLVVLIDETRTADESMRTYITNDGESGDWLATASSASSRPINKSSSDIADEEIALWKMRLQQLPSHKNPLHELRRTSSVVPWCGNGLDHFPK